MLFDPKYIFFVMIPALVLTLFAQWWVKNAFKSASMLLRTGSDSIIEMVQSNEYAGATIQLNALLANSSLSEPQRDVSSAALSTLNQSLQAVIATSQPTTDPAAPARPPARTEEAAKAAATMEHYIMTK